MFKFDYDFVQNVYSLLMQENSIFYTISGLKVLAISFLILSWYKKFINSIDQNSTDTKKMPITPGEIIKGIVLILIIASYDQLLILLDSFFGAVEGEYAQINYTPIDYSNPETIGAEDSKSWMDSMKSMSTYVVDFFNDPIIILLKFGEALAWFADLIIYGIFLAERFFFLGVLRVLGGLAIVCLTVEKLEKWFWNWLGLYTATYLIIIPYFLINAFTNKIYETARTMMESQTLDIIGFQSTVSSLMIVVLIFVVILKYKLFKKANQVVMKIFN